MECIELNWLSKTYEKDQKQPSTHSFTELSKTKISPASIVKKSILLSYKDIRMYADFIKPFLFTLYRKVRENLDCNAKVAS